MTNTSKSLLQHTPHRLHGPTREESSSSSCEFSLGVFQVFHLCFFLHHSRTFALSQVGRFHGNWGGLQAD